MCNVTAKVCSGISSIKVTDVKNEEEWEKVIFGLFEGYTPQLKAK